MPINEYLQEVKTRHDSGISTEHSYRADLQNLILSIVDKINVTNEPKRQKCGAPDYIIQKKEVPLGYIEAKDIGIDLDKTEKSSQLKRYLKSLDNLILTDYLEFRFFKYGQKNTTIKIASIENDKIKVDPSSFDSFINHINDFCSFKGQTISSAEKLAKMMAQKARMMEEVLFNAVSDEHEDDNSLKDQLAAFRDILIHDLDEKTFADIYAQTITYGLFAARLHDETLEDFSRQEARELIPRSNPFLRNLFDYVSGAQLDERVVWIVDDLCEIFRATDLNAILSDFGSSTGQNDPFIHFYETFLAEYDPRLRKSRGVYYTPEPVVNFIVRAVDDILKEEFGLSKGLADTSKVKIKRKIHGTANTRKGQKGKDIYEEVEVHKVQILDPATGTGTFLAETIKQIYSKFKGQEGLWSSYVENDLIPRINGFEILMASYTMCHLKIEMLLKESGYKPKNTHNQPRLKVFLTNSLEEAHPDTGTLFASWLSREASAANSIKEETPVMCVIGNPPYSVSSSNKGDWIENLISIYKKDLNEKSYNSLSDDYVKFIKYGQHYIDKNGTGILAYISNNSFIDGLIFKQMRKNILESFDNIYILDLHGNAKKKEVCSDGTLDQNVFDIQQGVSINIFIKTGFKKKNELGEIFHFSLQGKREYKYNYLLTNSYKTCKWNQLNYQSPNYYFIPKDYSLVYIYNKGFSIVDLFKEYSSGIQTEFDSFSIQENYSLSKEKLNNLKKLSDKELLLKYNIDNKFINKVDKAIKDIQINSSKILPLLYRPFDIKSCIYTGVSNGIMGRPRSGIMNHFMNNNIGLAVTKLNRGLSQGYYFVLNSFSDRHLLDTAGDSIAIIPLHLYADVSSFEDKSPNFNKKYIDPFESNLHLTFSDKKEEHENTFRSINILDYIYAILHSPTYREKYKEFLKIDFPRIPYPEDRDTFWKLVKLGEELRTIHLLENTVVKEYITSYPIDGSNIVEKPQFKDGKVFINKEQFFSEIPEVAWNFYIGGYQPAQKWLKDRKGRELSVDDLLHYQKIIVALTETDRIMKEIDKVVSF